LPIPLFEYGGKAKGQFFKLRTSFIMNGEEVKEK